MILIIGGGIIGTGIAYYLAQAGVKDITLIEKEKLLGLGATQHCSGGVRHQFTTPINCKFSIEAFKDLTKFDMDYKKLGYLILDMKSDSMPRVKMQRTLGIPTEYLKADEIKKRFPYINTEGVVSGTFYKEDGIADPGKLLSIYEKGARDKGLGTRFMMETEVQGFLTESIDDPRPATRDSRPERKVVGVKTDKGDIKADTVILAAGVGSQELGKTIGLDIKFNHIRKYVFVIDGFDFDFPLTMEIPTGWYIKKEGKECLIGMSGKDEKVDFEKQDESMEETVEASIHRFPMTEKSGIRKVLSTMSDETPDKHAIIDSPVPGLIIATGFSGHGFMHSPVTGRIIASLLKGEKPPLDISELKLKREHIKETIAI